jgi:hypothetical protein
MARDEKGASRPRATIGGTVEVISVAAEAKMKTLRARGEGDKEEREKQNNKINEGK